MYKEKNAHLEQFLEQVSPFEFYREIFPEGSFERKGHYEDKKPNGIAVSLPGKGGSVNGIALGIEGDGKARRYIITDDLKMLEELMDTDFTIMAPISYYGKKRSGKFARFLYALVFDIDGVGMPQLRDVLHQMNKDILPKATFVVNSGTGLHLYYVLSEPVPMYPQNQHYLKELKYSLTRQIWNRYTSSIKQPQMQGLMQGFRVVGSGTKLGKGYPVVAFQFGGRVELDDLLEYIPASNGERQKLQGILKKSSMPLAVAKEKYPDWYERRIVKGERRGRWTVKRDLYDWWLRRIQDEIRVGHRYHGIMTLAIYAKKCGIEEEELRQDAYSLLLPYDEMSIEEVNRFTREDVEAALSMFNEDYVTFPRDDIARLSGMSMPVNKRNWRKRKEHIQVMNTMKALKKQLGEAVPVGRPQGSGTAQERVYQWRQQHPEGRKADCHRETGLDPKTIRKWWDCPLPPLRFESGHITVPVEPSKMTSDFLVAAQAEDD
ncbi:hypothetical protein [Oscillibacter sp. 1-3]|uniref:hypothetical protein n=1 Tax=Oscillibacter sp. 1-3 TaxID=1235797 RepID=UPI001FA7E300|nr:hypothetical protein [Oscillibacter sp. 1-3]